MIDLPGEEAPRLSVCTNCLEKLPRTEYLAQNLMCGKCYSDFRAKAEFSEYMDFPELD